MEDHVKTIEKAVILLWHHNGHDGVSNHQPRDCLLNRLFIRRSKKTSKPRVTGLCAGNSPITGEFPAQMASNAENVSIWWRHHGNSILDCMLVLSHNMPIFLMGNNDFCHFHFWNHLFYPPLVVKPVYATIVTCWLIPLEAMSIILWQSNSCQIETATV